MKAKLRYGFIQDRNKKYTVKDMCRVLGVSESGYYRYVQNIGKPSKNEILSVAIADIFEEHPYNDNYGVRRVQMPEYERLQRLCVKKDGFTTAADLVGSQKPQQKCNRKKI